MLQFAKIRENEENKRVRGHFLNIILSGKTPFPYIYVQVDLVFFRTTYLDGFTYQTLVQVFSPQKDPIAGQREYTYTQDDFDCFVFHTSYRRQLHLSNLNASAREIHMQSQSPQHVIPTYTDNNLVQD